MEKVLSPLAQKYVLVSVLAVLVACGSKSNSETKRDCSSSLLDGSPLAELKMMAEEGTESDLEKNFEDFAQEMTVAEPGIAQNVDTFFTRQNIKNALVYFAKNRNAGEISTKLSDYDLDRANPDWAAMMEADWIPREKFEALLTDPIEMTRFYVWVNLVAQELVEEAVGPYPSCD